MNRILMLVCALALATAASAQLYKSVDKDGRITYSDQPPPALESKQLKIDPAPAGTPAPSARQRVKELDLAVQPASELSVYQARQENNAE